ncbi:YihY/virulence factor BrkB family protein [Salinibacterium sp. ZJ70]|uniref:YihY/virulence factor BrkB family protein n=1 Tax=Salinibacterium sp. ZJ70 TaxID=2708084 RepID=UPI00141E659E|nr:YihY/virulence factor BrkB family protein [Salinibacterium sp. ZJ70]
MDDALSRVLDPEDPGPSARLPRGSWKLAVRRAWHGFMRHRGYDAAAALTFFTTVATFPAALAFVSAFALVGDRDQAVADIVAIAHTLFPEQIAESFADPVEQLLSLPYPGLALAAALLLLLWTSSGYATGFGRAVNAVYEVEEGRPFWRFRLRMLLVAALLIALIAAIVLTLLTTPEAASDILGRRDLAPVVVTVWAWIRWPLTLVLMWLFVSVLYAFTPNVRHQRLVWVSVGSTFAIAVWILCTIGYAIYATLLGAYGALYGSIGSLLVALLWAYLTNLALVAGAELDAEFVRLRQLARGLAAEEVIRVPVRDTARNHLLARQREADVADALRLRDGQRERHRHRPSRE